MDRLFIGSKLFMACTASTIICRCNAGSEEIAELCITQAALYRSAARDEKPARGRKIPCQTGLNILVDKGGLPSQQCCTALYEAVPAKPSVAAALLECRQCLYYVLAEDAELSCTSPFSPTPSCLLTLRLQRHAADPGTCPMCADPGLTLHSPVFSQQISAALLMLGCVVPLLLASFVHWTCRHTRPYRSRRHHQQHLHMESKRLNCAIRQTGTHRPRHVHWEHLREAQRLDDVPQCCSTLAEHYLLPMVWTELDVNCGPKVAVRALQARTLAELLGLIDNDFVCKIVLHTQTTEVRAAVHLEAQPVSRPCGQLPAQACAQSAWYIYVQQVRHGGP